MHEMMLVENVVGIVLKQAALAEAAEVVSVRLRIGELRDIVDELMEKCFRFVARGTIAENAGLHIEKVPFVVKCSSCGHEQRENIRNIAALHCEQCSGTEMRLVSGREFFIEDIEIR